MENLILKAINAWAERSNKKLNIDKIEEDLKVKETVKEDKTFIKQFKSEEKISVEILFRPNVPDLHGHWLSEETIQKGFESAQRAKQEGRLKPNLFHLQDDEESLEIVNEYLVPVDCVIGEQEVKKGTWVVEMKFHNEELWKQRTEVVELPDGTMGTRIGGLSPRFWGKVNDPIEKATTDNVTKDDKGNLVYRGQKFVGYNKPMRSNRDGKQGMVLAKKGDQIKTVHFGDPSMPDNQTKEQYEAFVSRFKDQKGWDDPFSALYWSRSWLWPSSRIGKGAKEFYTLK